MLFCQTPSKSNSQSTINKLLQKDLKQLIFDLQSTELVHLFKNLQIDTNISSFKQFTKIGLKCSECHIMFQNFQSKGYGRDEQQALINSVKIILESMISSSHRIQNIKRALKYCSKYRKPLISSQNTGMSSTKKSMKKVQGMESVSITKKPLQLGSSYKKQLQFSSSQKDTNKQNVSRAMNETLDLDTSFPEQKMFVNKIETIRPSQNVIKSGEMRKITPPLPVASDSKNFERQKKCSVSSNAKDCIYYEVYKHSQDQIRNLNARIKLLEEQNSMMKKLLLLKDSNSEFFGQKITKPAD